MHKTRHIASKVPPSPGGWEGIRLLALTPAQLGTQDIEKPVWMQAQQVY